jgi:poly(glycerol-phosphate) alpha-glucosyltransferase
MTTLHGMLDSWALGNSRWKKNVCAWAYEKRCLDDAACLHAFTGAELTSAREFGLKNPVCIIPNGVDLPEPTVGPAPWNGAVAAGKKSLLYLGRLHPKKGLMNLLEAWRIVQRRCPASAGQWSLVISGWDQGGHERELKARALEMGVAGDVVFAGPMFGDAKDAAYAHADAFVLPSHSEGLPMTVLEAWAHGKPVLMTPRCNLSEGVAAGAAMEAQPDPASLAEQLAELIGATDSERAAMGARGLELVRRQFAWPKVAAEMHSVYRWLVGGGSAPACVVKP